jgi:hypothetical protein
VVTQVAPVVAVAVEPLAVTTVPVAVAPVVARDLAAAPVGAPTPGADLLVAASVVVVVTKTSCSPPR